jgi:hypothetical protein
MARFLVAILVFVAPVVESMRVEQTARCPAVMSAGICKIGDASYILENMGGFEAKDLACIQPWCDQGKDNCCQVIETLRDTLDGKTARSLNLKPEVFDKLAAAVNTVTGAKPSATESATTTESKATEAPVAKPSAVPEVELTDAALPTEPKPTEAPVAKPSAVPQAELPDVELPKAPAGVLRAVPAGACKKKVRSMTVCKQDSQHLIENLIGFENSDIVCIPVWANAGIERCTATVNAVKNKIKGESAKTLYISDEQYNKLLTIVA